MLLPQISQQITIYVGIFLVVSGLIGNGINILVFSTFRNYRTTPCTFYFLSASIFNFLYIATTLIPRIVSVGFGIDLSKTSTSWCKIRQYCIVTTVIISVTFSCLATIDQFFVTSRSANVRRFSSIKWAHRLVFIFIIVWFLHGTPVLISYQISPITMICLNTNHASAIYSTIFFLVLICAIPVTIMVIFGYLTYHNMHSRRVLAEQQADRQLVKMTLIQVALDVICVAPYGILIAYSLITSGVSKDTNRQIIESFIGNMINIIFYFYYAVC
jgi:hypothetical protein